MTTLKELRKENEALCEENEEVKQQYNALRNSVLESYELLTDEPLETEGGDGDDDDNDNADDEE